MILPKPVFGSAPRNFTQRRTGCVIVSFSAEAGADINTQMHVIAVVDGFGCAPYDSILVSNVTDFSDHAMNFLCPNVAGPGNHIAKMMFRSNGAGSVALSNRTMIVHYAK